ncbi:MAG: ATP-dependent Clp protease ATP-binding subunit [Planctomycetes bacterium]|nr:ATP-dependent Clp protease ATP-binding subunit [Planctomycetota bacterium]
MIRMETNVVLKYCALIDEFIKIRVFTNEEIAELLKLPKVPNKSAYQQLIVNACIVNYNDVILPHLRRTEDTQVYVDFEDELYRLCVEVNPNLDISRVTIPVGQSESTELHLFQQTSPKKSGEYASALKNIETEIGDRVVGQPEAVHTVARAIRKAAAGLRDRNRPIGTFFFVGQTGVGKTELAKALTEILYKDPSRLIRIDCSEYSMPHEYAKLIGAPPGYIGHNEGGVLTETMKKKGSGVVLFDEVEKADAHVHDVLLQLLDEGFVTDSKGVRVGFNDAVVIMTSNVGVEELEAFRSHAGFDFGKRQVPSRDELLRETLGALKKQFRPEFINRVDEVVLFNPLSMDVCTRIVDLLLKQVQAHAQNARLTINVSPKARRYLAEKGYRPEFGARELKRTIEEMVEAPISEFLIDGKLREGRTVRVTLKAEKLAFAWN